MIDRARLSDLLARERALAAERNPRSKAAFADAGNLFGGVPMTWMNKTAAGFPLYLATARGARLTDLDGHELIDFCLGDTGAMAGHSPEPTVRAVQERFGELGGATAMLPTEDAAAVGRELERRFGLPRWSFSLTATDANRWAIRLARAITGRPKILFHAWCYHGSVDESLIVTNPAFDPAAARAARRGSSADGVSPAGAASNIRPGTGDVPSTPTGYAVPSGISRPGNVGAPVDVTETSRVVEYNDLEGLERELAHGDVAAFLMEPALTNIGIVLPEPGYLEAVREITRRHGVLLINDETHTFSAGPGGATGAWGLDPDVITVGKALAGGIPCGAYGLSEELAGRILERDDLDLVDMGGVGGTLAGNPISTAAMRATLTEVLTDDAFARMTALATNFTAGVQRVIDRHGLPWSVSQLGARTEYRFCSPAPRTGSASAAAADADLEDHLHAYLMNRGVLLTPFHNMALMSPATTEADVDRHEALFAEAVAELVGTGA